MYWKIGIIQHPMYLLIKEDTTCAERTPPWGEPTIDLYIERVRNTLKRLREYPLLKIGFEWSALELELLAQDAPDVFAEMRELAKEGRLAFYNGTYAQPHLQIQSAEANIRQFEFGARVYRELCDYQVTTYAHQETSVHEQVPQLLDAFKIKYSALPQFPSTLQWLDGGEIIMRLGEPHFFHGVEFVLWVGLDGTQVPLYLTPRRHPVTEWITRETMAGLMHGPTIMLENRDLVDVSAEWLAERAGAEMVLLDEAFAERLAGSPPRAHCKHFTYWSYVEGIRAEELSRSNWIAETSALQAEALDSIAFALLRRPVNSTDSLWKAILTSQHHDVSCFCGPELRAKAIGWLEHATRTAQEMTRDAAHAIAAQVDTIGREGLPLIVFNTLPHAQRAPVSVQVPSNYARLIDARGNPVPVKVLPGPDDNSSIKFIVDSLGLGYDTYWLVEGVPSVQETETQESFVFENAFYRATIQPDGTFSSLIVKPSSAELLANGAPAGNLVRATDSTGISPALNPGLVGKPKWEIPTIPPEVHWQVTETARLRTTPLGTTAIVNAKLGEQVGVSLAIDFYHDLARIDLAYTFDFQTASIGIFYLDDTKLRVEWRLGYQGEVYHDIPFGVVRTDENCPIHPTSWLDISDGDKGLAFLHQGTFKHWIRNKTLFNLFAWGEETNAIGDRIYRENWAKSFDQRLHGTHIIHTALYPHEGDWRAASVIPVARGYNRPFLGHLTDPHSGPLPPGLNLLSILEREITATSVTTQDSKLCCRLYSFGEETRPVSLDSDLLQTESLKTLGGEAISELTPYQIGSLTLAPRHSANDAAS